jgi:hypothetical protein
MRTFALLLALLALARLTPSRLSAQAYVAYHEDAWATTICLTHPVTWYSNELPASEWGMVEAHEADHRRLMASFDSCRSFRAWTQADPEHAVQVEAEAFCAGARYDTLTGRLPSFAEAVWAQARTFAGYYPWDVADAVSAIFRYCR